MGVVPLIPRNNLSDVASASTALSNLGGQPLDADLTALAALGYTSGSFLIKKTAANTYSLIALTAAGEALLDDADAAAQRTTMGALGGSLGSTDNRLLRSDGTGGATAQNTGITVDDSNNVTGVVNLTASGNASLTNTSLLTFGTAVTDVLIKKGASQKLYVRCGDDSGFADLFWRNSEAQNNGYIGWTGRSILKSPSDGRVNFWNYAETDYSDVYVKGLTASGTITVGASTFAALPSASANTGAILRVTDRGQKLVHSDGTDWRFVHDNTIAS